MATVTPSRWGTGGGRELQPDKLNGDGGADGDRVAVESGERGVDRAVALTANGYLDHAPLVSGPLADGSVLAVWTRNYANQLMGPGLLAVRRMTG